MNAIGSLAVGGAFNNSSVRAVLIMRAVLIARTSGATREDVEVTAVSIG
jgi:hypothetical protein